MERPRLSRRGLFRCPADIEVTLSRGVLARLLATQPEFPPLAAGEIVPTGTITDAWPVVAGETWSSDYGDLGMEALTLTLT